MGSYAKYSNFASLKIMKIELSGHYSYKRLLVSSLPSMAMMIIGSLYSIVDGLFVSNYVGLTPFAGLNIAWPAIMVVGALGLMVGTGGSALISILLGQKNLKKACETFTTLVAFTILMAVALGIPMYILMPKIVVMLGAEGEELIRNAALYGRFYAVGMPAFMLQMAFQPFFMAAEKPELGTKLSIACGLANMILDAVFIVVLGWGLAGAAAASIIACCIGGFYPLWYFRHRRSEGQLRLTRIKFEKRAIVNTCTNGSSEYIGNIAFSLVSMCYMHQLMKFYGEPGVAAYSVIMYIGYIFAAIYIGYNLTVAPVVGYNYGAGDTKELHSLLTKSMAIVFGLGMAMTAIAQVAARPAALLFVGYDADIVALTTRAEKIYMMSFLICGLNMFTSAWFTGLGNGLISAASAFTRSLVFELGCVFLLPVIFGAEGIWYSVIIAEVLSLALCIFLLKRFQKQYGY